MWRHKYFSYIVVPFDCVDVDFAVFLWPTLAAEMKAYNVGFWNVRVTEKEKPTNYSSMIRPSIEMFLSILLKGHIWKEKRIKIFMHLRQWLWYSCMTAKSSHSNFSEDSPVSTESHIWSRQNKSFSSISNILS